MTVSNTSRGTIGSVTYVYLILAVVAVGLLAAVVVQRVTLPGVEDAVGTESFQPLPRGGVDPGDLDSLRFDPALRGYRMAQVDGVLERLVEELRLRDAEIARLRDLQDGPPGAETETEPEHGESADASR